MASTIPLSRTLQYVSTNVQLRPTTGVGGFTLEPGFSIADWVRGFILAPPFAWNWNRKQVTFKIDQTNQDYNINLSDFGWLERASITTGPGNNKELQVRLTLGENSTFNEPVSIAAMYDDGAGNILFRLFPFPDKAYTVIITYQKAAPLFANLTDSWVPIPDKFSYLYNQGCIAKFYEQTNDEKFAFEMQTFFRQVIAANSGLSDSQVNIFLNERISSQREVSEKLGTDQLGRAGRYGAQG